MRTGYLKRAHTCLLNFIGIRRRVIIGKGKAGKNQQYSFLYFFNGGEHEKSITWVHWFKLDLAHGCNHSISFTLHQ